MTPVEMDRGASQFDLTLYVQETAEGLRGTFEYSTDLFDRTTIERLAGHYVQLLAGVVADPTQRLSQLAAAHGGRAGADRRPGMPQPRPIRGRQDSSAWCATTWPGARTRWRCGKGSGA